MEIRQLRTVLAIAETGSLTRAAFLSARNDALANVAIVATGLITAFLWRSAWPDVVVGLAIAAFADRSRHEKIAKTIIFMPMAISLVGAGVIWKFIYAVRDPSDVQIGLLNAIVVALGGEQMPGALVRKFAKHLLPDRRDTIGLRRRLDQFTNPALLFRGERGLPGRLDH